MPLKIFNENLLDPNLGVLRVAVKGKFQGIRQKVQKKKKKKTTEIERERKKLEAVRDRFLLPSLGALVIWGYWAQNAGHPRGEGRDKKKGEKKKGRKRKKRKNLRKC